MIYVIFLKLSEDLKLFLADWMFTQDTSNNFQDMIDRIYKETSRHLLDVLHNKYKFMDHLKV